MLIKFICLVVTSTIVKSELSLAKLDGAVNSGDFVYYTVDYKGNLLLVLETSQGDADIYITEKEAKPGYHPDSYDLHSATCGNDTIYVPKTMKRPITVGIFGHSPYEASEFTLEVFEMSDNDVDHFKSAPLQSDVDKSDDGKMRLGNDLHENEKRVKTKRKLKSITKNLWPFFELFEMLFL